MGNQPRKHHFVPQFYLGGFTDSGTVDGSLSVLDTERIKEWRSKPKDAAHRRDFHEIDSGPSGDPMIVEKRLGQLEGKWSAALKDVLDQRKLPDDELFGDLMMFIAFMAVRVPRIRSTISTFIDEVGRKEAFARKWLESQGQMDQSEDNDNDDLFDQTWHVQQMIQMAATLAPLLSLRSWQLWIADSTTPDLICSDSPVSLNWIVPVSGLYPPGYGLKNTVVSVPLHKRVAMVGMFDVESNARMIERSEVSQINSATGLYAGQLYYPGPDFVWFMKDGNIGGRSDLLNALNSPLIFKKLSRSVRSGEGQRRGVVLGILGLPNTSYRHTRGLIDEIDKIRKKNKPEQLRPVSWFAGADQFAQDAAQVEGHGDRLVTLLNFFQAA